MSLQLNSIGNNVTDLLHLLAASVVKDASGVKYLRLNIVKHTCAQVDPVAAAGVYEGPEEVLRQIVNSDTCGDSLTINISVPSLPA